MAENINVRDFAFDSEDMQRISELDTGKTEIFAQYDVNLVKQCNLLSRQGGEERELLRLILRA